MKKKIILTHNEILNEIAIKLNCSIEDVRFSVKEEEIEGEAIVTDVIEVEVLDVKKSFEISKYFEIKDNIVVFEISDIIEFLSRIVKISLNGLYDFVECNLEGVMTECLILEY